VRDVTGTKLGVSALLARMACWGAMVFFVLTSDRTTFERILYVARMLAPRHKKAWNRRCRLFHSPRLWYAHYCKNRQRQSPRRYEYSSPYPIRIRGRVYTHPRVIYRCYVQDSNREFTRFRRVLNVALVNAFIMSENRYPPFLRRRWILWLRRKHTRNSVQSYELFFKWRLKIR